MDGVEIENEAEAAKVEHQDDTPEEDLEDAALKPDQGSELSQGNHELLSLADEQDEEEVNKF